MGETDNRMVYEGKGLFIIRNGQKIAKYEAGEWVPLLPGVVVRATPDGIKIEMRIKPVGALSTVETNKSHRLLLALLISPSLATAAVALPRHILANGISDAESERTAYQQAD